MSGKGDTYRPVDKARYDRNYLRIFGQRCPVCEGRGHIGVRRKDCPICGGLGYVERRKK